MCTAQDGAFVSPWLGVRPWAVAEDQVKVAASAGRVEVAFSLFKWPSCTGHCEGMPIRAPPSDSPERVRLKKAACHRTEHRLRVRAQVVLHAVHGRSSACIARETGLHVDTVCRWRGRFAQAGLPGLTDRQRSCAASRTGTPARPCP
ncbi:helix-turn-helix domain-containing protein [Streptomyces gamaensis]|uniref:Helix-turn-helix domain-containing protein n=1 Tax=Streptomyces gamaensis TaxID=1763542 RepID=A0ABW0Z707_9ACTN